MDLDFTGERLIPNKPELRHLYQEHIIRYMFATQFTKSKTVLDAGCGTGYGTFLILANGAKKVVGVDIEKKAIEYCKSNYNEKNLEFVCDDCTKLNVDDSSFDIVVSFEVIEHLLSAESFLSEVKRILKKNGVFIVSTPNKITYPSGNPFHVTEYDKEEFLVLLKKYFLNVQILYQNYPPTIAIHDGKKIELIEQVNGNPTETCDDIALYFIAICSDKPVKDYTNTIFLFDNKTIMLEEYPVIKKRIIKLERDLRSKEQELIALKSELTQHAGIKSFDIVINELNKKNEVLRNQLDETLLKLDNLYQSFIGKNMYSLHKEILDKTYRELLRRPPDEIALNHYLPKLQNNQISKEEIRYIIMQSDEYKNLQLEM